MTEELKPCPFCGGEARVDHRKKRVGRAAPHVAQIIRVHCKRSGCEGSTKQYRGRTGREKAIAAWNRRADDWRDIESAPRDGRVLVCGPRKGGGRYQEVCNFYKDKWTVEWVDGCLPPTHWKPLPTPPEGE